MDWTYWMTVSVLLAIILLLVVVALRRPSRCTPVLRSDVESRLRTARYLTAEDRSQAERALTGMPAERYWFLLGLIDDIEEGRRSASILNYEMLRWESDASLAS
jgi:hypothetical protein